MCLNCEIRLSKIWLIIDHSLVKRTRILETQLCLIVIRWICISSHLANLHPAIFLSFTSCFHLIRCFLALLYQDFFSTTKFLSTKRKLYNYWELLKTEDIWRLIWSLDIQVHPSHVVHLRGIIDDYLTLLTSSFVVRN